MIIPREPQVPQLNSQEIHELTEIVFGPKVAIQKCDVIFVFGGTQTGNWQTPIQAYNHGLGKKIIITGGQSKTAGSKYKTMMGDNSEADLIKKKLIAAGISDDEMIIEDQSTNSLENVIFACQKFDFNKINSILFITKSHVVGRHWRTLAQHVPSNLTLIPYSFDADYGGVFVTQDNWMTTTIGRSRVWGEYLRIQTYIEKGDIKADL